MGGLVFIAALSAGAGEWRLADVGGPLMSSSVAENNGEWTVVSKMPSSADGMADYLTFLCQRWPGDFVLSAEVTCETDTFPSGQLGRLGLVVRESFADPGGRFISLGIGRQRNMFLELRRASGARRESFNAICGNPASKRFQLKRVGDVFEASFGDGESGPLAYFVTTELGLAQELWVGFGVRSDGLDAPVRGVFKNVTLRFPSAEEARESTYRVAPPVVWRAAMDGVRDGEEVPQWSDTANKVAVLVPKALTEVVAPRWSVAALNGRPALRFDGTHTLLAFEADRCPLGHAYRGTVVCVFQTAARNQAGTLISCDTAYSSDNLADDWSLSLGADGALSARFGFVYQWDGELRSRRTGLNDGQPHVAIFSWGGDDRRLRLNVDGQTEERFFAFWRKRAFLKTAFGGRPDGKGSFFAGGLAEIILIKNQALNGHEENRMGWALAQKYGVQDHGFVRLAEADSSESALASVLDSTDLLILKQPQDCAVKRGQAADFEVAAKGCTYQWYFDDRLLDGMTADRLRVETGAMPSGCCGAVLECRVSNGERAVFSRKAALRIE